MRKGTISITLAVLVGSLYFLGQTFSLPPAFTPGVPGPAYVPRLYLVVVIVLCGLILLQVLHRRGEADSPVSYPRLRLLITGLGTSVAYLAITPYLGYFPATLLFVSVLTILLKPPGRWTWLLTSVGYVVFVYLVFYKLFQVPLPQGIWLLIP